MRFERKCPHCENLLTYTTKGHLTRAILKNSVCVRCLNGERKTHSKLNCLYCGEIFEVKKYLQLTSKYCSRRCKDRDNHEKIRPKVNRRIKSQKPGARESTYKSGAKTRGLKYELSKEQFLSFWNKSCSYCGSVIDTIGLDRIDSDKGYTMKNVVSCCKTCIMMKMVMSQNDFILQCKNITNYCGDKL